MAEDRMAVLETVRKAIAEGDVDFLREGVRVLAQAVMEAEVTELTGVPKGERDPERRLTNRNGYRDRRWDTRVGTMNLSIPRVRDGSYFPSPARAAAAGRASPPRGRPGGVRPGRQHPPGRRPRRRPRASPRSARARSAGSAPPSTPRSRPSGPARSATRRTRTCGSMPRTSRSAKAAGSCRWRRSWRPVSPTAASVGSWASSSPPATTRAVPGRRSSGSLVERGLSGRPPRHQRRPPGPGQGRPRAAPRRGLAALPGPLHAQRPGPRPAPRPEHDRLGHPLDLRAARRALGPGAVGSRHREHPAALPGGRRAA